MTQRSPKLWNDLKSRPAPPQIDTRGSRSTRRPSVTDPNLVPDITSPSSPISPWPPTHRRNASTQLKESLRSVKEDEPSPREKRQRSEKAQNGYIAHIGTRIAYGIYLIWAFLPPSWADRLYLGWLPDRNWTIIIPSFLCVIVLLTYFSYAALMAYHTPSFKSLSWLADSRGQQPKTISELGYNPFDPPSHVKIMHQSIDVPLGIVNRRRFPPRRRPEGMGLKREYEL